MGLINQKVVMRVVNICFLFSLTFTALGQNITKGDFFYYKDLKPQSDSILIRGVVLSKETLSPIPNLPPVITYLESKAENKEFVFNYEGTYNSESGFFEFKVAKGKYRFICSQMGYHEIKTKWVPLKNNLTLIFLMRKYENEGFH